MSLPGPTLTKTGLPLAPGNPTAPPQNRSPQVRNSQTAEEERVRGQPDRAQCTKPMTLWRGEAGMREGGTRFIWGWCRVEIHKASPAKQKA